MMHVFKLKPPLTSPFNPLRPTPPPLGAGTALLGKEAAMACTVAVETAIGEHYDSQLRRLMAEPEGVAAGDSAGEDRGEGDSIGGLAANKELVDVIRKFRDEELQHLETGIQHSAEQVGARV